MTPDELRLALQRLHLSRRAATALLELGKNGERSLLRMIRGERHIPERFAQVLADAEEGAWPEHFAPPAQTQPHPSQRQRPVGQQQPAQKTRPKK